MSNTDFVFLYKSEKQAAEQDFGLLKYFFRSVEKNAPWVHCLYFVTAGEVPEWLNTRHEKLKVVPYSAFMPEETLPMENLNAVSINLHRIEGILEQFVVFSGMTFFTRRVYEMNLYKNGIPIDSAILDIPCATYGKDNEPHVMLNNAGIINEHFNKKEITKRFKSLFYSRRYGVDADINKQLKNLDAFPGFAVFPIPYCMLKSVYERVWHEQHRLLDVCSKQRIPSKRDFDFHLMRIWNICEGRFIPLKTGSYCCAELGNDDLDAIVTVIRKRKYKVIGFTDATADSEYQEVREELTDAFEKVFPNRSAYELERNSSKEGLPDEKTREEHNSQAVPSEENITDENITDENISDAPSFEEEVHDFPGEEFEDDDDDFYELGDIVEGELGTKERAELIEKMRAGNRRKRHKKKV